MRQFLIVVYFLAGLAGCDLLPNHSISTRSERDGVVLLDSLTTREARGAEKFSCRASATGQCHYLVYVDRCTTTDAAAEKADRNPGDPRADCTPQTLEVFSVAAGTSTVIAALDPAFRQCVSNEKTPVAPACSAP